MPVPAAQAAPALARYLEQQAANRLSVQQRGAALREAEQQARSRAAAEAPRVLNQLEAEARAKVCTMYCTVSLMHSWQYSAVQRMSIASCISFAKHSQPALHEQQQLLQDWLLFVHVKELHTVVCNAHVACRTLGSCIEAAGCVGLSKPYTVQTICTTRPPF
jgi:hypothetical protein